MTAQGRRLALELFTNPVLGDVWVCISAYMYGDCGSWLLSLVYHSRLAKPLERLKQKHSAFQQRMVSIATAARQAQDTQHRMGGSGCVALSVSKALGCPQEAAVATQAERR